MKVLHVNKFLYRRGGAEAYMEDAAALQRAAGHEVAFCGMAHPDNVHLEYAADVPRAPGAGPAARVPARQGPGRGPDDLVDRGRAGGWTRSLDLFQPDVVHLHNIYHQLSPSVLAPLRRREVPAVMTLHDYKLACPTYLFLDKGSLCEACLGGKFHNAILRRCNDGSLTASALPAVELALHTWTRAYDPIGAFICPSNFIKGKMTEAGVFPDRLRVLHNPVDLGTEGVKTALGGPVFYAGRLSPEKGVDVLVHAAALLPGVEVVIAGDGPERGRLEELARTLPAPGVTFLGRIPGAEVARRMRAAGVVAVPSRCYENQPLSVLEAFAAGVPVVGAALGGVAEVVEDGRPVRSWRRTTPPRWRPGSARCWPTRWPHSRWAAPGGAWWETGSTRRRGTCARSARRVRRGSSSASGEKSW